MKKILIALLVALTVVSCQKKETAPGVTQQEVSFAALQLDLTSGLKSTDDAPECLTDLQGELLVPTVAKVVIEEYVTGEGDQTFWPEVFMLDGKMYTQAIKLPVIDDGPTSYTVKFFGLYDAVDPRLLMATPEAGSPYSEYTTPDVTFTFDVGKFAKAEVPVQVLCFMEDDYLNFGFNWFEITEIVVREFCFFGDICLNGDPFVAADFDDSEGYYESPADGIIDIPAVMKIEVTVNDGSGPGGSLFFDNIGVLNEPLCVPYPDNLYETDNFTFELSLWLPGPSGFAWQLYATYTSTDDGTINEVVIGDDLVLDFVVGSCAYNGDPDNAPDDEFDFLFTPPVPLCGYGVVTSGALNFSDAGWGGWSVPAGKVVLGGGFQMGNATMVAASEPGLPGVAYPHYTFGPTEYGWVVQGAPDGQSSPGSYIYAAYADMPAGYEVIWSPVLNYNGSGGWGGWSAPAGKVVLGGGFVANGPVNASAPGTPGSVWPHYTFGPDEYGWVVQDAGATQIQIYVICANEPTGYDIVIGGPLSYGDTGWGGWSATNGKVVTGGGFAATQPVAAAALATPLSVWPHYTYGANEYGICVQDAQNSQGSSTTLYVIYASTCP